MRCSPKDKKKASKMSTEGLSLKQLSALLKTPMSDWQDVPDPFSPETLSNSTDGASMPKKESGAAITGASSCLTEKPRPLRKKARSAKKQLTGLAGWPIDTPPPSLSSLSKDAVDQAIIYTSLSSGKKKKLKPNFDAFGAVLPAPIPKRRRQYPLMIHAYTYGKKYRQKHLKIAKRAHAEINIKVRAGRLLVSAMPDGTYTIHHYITNQYGMEKNPVFAGKIGTVAYYSLSKPAKKRIKELEMALRGFVNIIEDFTGDAYDKEGKPKAAYHVKQKVPSWYINSPDVLPMYQKGLPMHCKCGKHKTKDGLYSCADLHAAVATARSMLVL